MFLIKSHVHAVGEIKMSSIIFKTVSLRAATVPAVLYH